jgi:hypothetical protein
LCGRARGEEHAERPIRTFEYARQRAQQAQQDSSFKGCVGTHHYLLLACMIDTEGDMLAARVLKSFGLSYAMIKARAEELYGSVDASDGPGQRRPRLRPTS